VLRLMTDMLSDDEVANLKKTFAEMDENGDGWISIGELKNSLAKIKQGANVMEILKQADIDGDGKIDYNELLSTYVDRKLNAKEERMFVAFSKLDQNGDGRISAEELEGVLKKEHIFSSTDHDSVTKILKEADKDGDGKIDYEEFLSIMWAKSHTETDDEEKTTIASTGTGTGTNVATVPAVTSTTMSTTTSKPPASTSPASSANTSLPPSSSPTLTTSSADPSPLLAGTAESQVITRAINQSRSAVYLRYVTFIFVLLTLVCFILALGLRLWFSSSDLGLNCGLWSCCEAPLGTDAFCYAPQVNDDTPGMKFQAVRAFVVMGFAGSIVGMVVAGLAYFGMQDKLAKLVSAIMLFCLICAVIGFAIFVDYIKNTTLGTDSLNAGFGFDVLAAILSLVTALLATHVSRTIITQS